MIYKKNDPETVSSAIKILVEFIEDNGIQVVVPNPPLIDLLENLDHISDQVTKDIKWNAPCIDMPGAIDW